MSPSLHTILFIVQFGLCLVITLLSLDRFGVRDLKIKIIGIMFLVKCFGVLQFMIPQSFYSNLHTTQQKLESLPFDFIFITILYAVAFGSEYYTLFALYLITIVSLSVVSVFLDTYFFKDSFSEIVCSGLISVYSLFYFSRLFKETPKPPLEDNPMFWISIGILIYSSGTVFLAIMTSVLDKINQINVVLNLLHQFLSVTWYAIILTGLIVERKN